MYSARRLITAFLVMIIGGLSLALAGGVTLAQQGTPPAATDLHPAAIHAGTCSQPTADPAFQFGDVGPYTDDNGNALTQQDIQGTLTAPPLLTTTETKIDSSLDDLLANPYVIIVHQSKDNFDTYLACGEVGGYVQNDQLEVGLRPLNNSGFAGIAILKKNGDSTTGNIYLMQQAMALSGGQSATPVPMTPTAGPTIPPTPSPTPTTQATTVVTAVVPAGVTPTIVVPTPTASS